MNIENLVCLKVSNFCNICIVAECVTLEKGTTPKLYFWKVWTLLPWQPIPGYNKSLLVIAGCHTWSSTICPNFTTLEVISIV